MTDNNQHNANLKKEQNCYSTEIQEIKRFLAPHEPDLLPRYLKIRHIVQDKLDGWPDFQMPKHQIEMCILWFLDQAAITLTNHLTEKFLKTALIYHNTDYQRPEENVVDKIAKGCSDAISKYDKMELSQTINAACRQGLISKEDKRELHRLRETLRNPYSHAQQTGIHGDVTVPLVGAMVDENLNFQFQEPKEMRVSEVMPVAGFAVQMHAEANSIPYFEYVIDLIKRTLPKIAPDSKTSKP